MRHLGPADTSSTPAVWEHAAELSPSPIPPQHQHGEPQNQLLDYLRVLFKRWRLITAFALGAVVITAIACLFVRPLYTATTIVHIENDPPQVTTGIQQLTNGIHSVEAFQDQVKLLQSRALAASVIDDLQLNHDPAFLGSAGRPGLVGYIMDRFSSLYEWAQLTFNPPVRQAAKGPSDGTGSMQSNSLEPPLPPMPANVGLYMSWLEVLPVTNTRMIKVAFTTPSAKLSQRLANAHVREYIHRGLQAKFELTGEARQFLETEIARVERELRGSEDALNDFRRVHNVVSLEDKDTFATDRLSDLSRRLTAAQADRIATEAEYRLVSTRDRDTLPPVLGSSVVNGLKNTVSQLEVRKAELGETFLQDSPQVKEITSQLAQARAQLDHEITRAINGAESVYLAAKTKEDALRDQFNAEQATVLNLKELSGQYVKLQQAVTANRNLYATLLTRMHETDVVKGVQIANESIVDFAEEPGGPSHPQVTLNLLFALLFGLASGVSLAFVLENIDVSLKTPEDVRRVLRVPTLGVVPHFAYLPAPRSSTGSTLFRLGHKAEVVNLIRGGGSMHIEAYRSIRTSVLFSNPERPPRTILVTSSRPGEGKTSTTVNLALSLAQMRNRVVVVDADLRQSRCHKALGMPAAPGLSQVLRGRKDLDSVVQRLNLENGQVTLASESPADGPSVDLLQSGEFAVDASELLTSSRAREVLQELTARYEMVLIDSPPVFPITDAALLATVVDGVVLVIRGQKTEREITREALERLRFMNATIIGVVLNGVDPGSTDYYRYSYYFSSEHVA